MNRYEVIYEYHDSYCLDDRWSRQSNIVYADDNKAAALKVIKFNGLGLDCSFRIVSVKKI